MIEIFAWQDKVEKHLSEKREGPFPPPSSVKDNLIVTGFVDCRGIGVYTEDAMVEHWNVDVKVRIHALSHRICRIRLILISV